MGDFNTQIDSDRRGQNVAVGLHGTAKETTKNGERLTSLCVDNGLKIGNTFFQHKDIHKKTRLSPNGMKLTTSASTTDGDRHCQTSEYIHGADVSTDHWWARSGSS